MSRPRLHVLVSLVVLMAMGLAAFAAEPTAQSHRCASVVDPSDRLVCYDAAFPPAANTKSEPEAQRLKALEEFGLRKTELRSNEPEHVRDITPELIEATIASVSSRPTGERVVRLDSGQVWMLTEVTTKGHLKSGDRVAIRRAALGSFMLVTPSRISLRARRIN